MSAEHPASAGDMKWWGWGDPAQEPELPAHALEFLRREIGMPHQLQPPVALDAVRLRPSALRDTAREALTAAVGADAVRDDRRTRVLHAAGKSYPDLVRQRAGRCDEAPDAVVFPDSHDEVRAVLELCARERVAVVPFGGGTSVVGGVEPLRESFESLIALDLGRCKRLVALDERSLTAVLESGLRCPEAESLLAQRGLTMGHFPQSYEFATVGGCVATRSAGQASTGYGRIDKNVLGLRCATPIGDLDLASIPATAAGPSVRDLVVGSEGTLGVITQTALRVHPRPAGRRYEGWFFRSFREGGEALRALEQADAAPHVARLSDEEETRLSLAMAGMRGLKGTAARAYLSARGYTGGCLMILGWEGDERAVVQRRRRGAAHLRRAGGLAMGRAPGSAWERTRFAAPYLRDALLDRGVMVETLETATQWSQLMDLHDAVAGALRDALTARGTPPLVACHISHLYPSGASLYFTFIARQEAEDPIAQWRAAKSAACDAIVTAGGTITHHHAVGRDHVPWLEAEIGQVGVTALRAAKEALDPAGVMNPGKLLPAAEPAQAPAAAS